MTITKNRLQSNGVPSLTVESENYQVRIFYDGNYRKDFSTKVIDQSKIMTTCKLLNEKAMPITILNGKVAIKNTLPMEIYLDGMDTALDDMLKSRDDMASLQLIYDTYFNPG